VVNPVIDCTVPEKILLAAFQLEQEGQSPFSAEALIVASWQRFPRTFGLKGYADQYPDSNKVLSSIMGVKGLARRGWLAKMGQKLYTLTREGQVLARRLSQGGETKADTAVQSEHKLSREHEKFLLGLFSSPATRKFEEGLKQEVTFADACRYWGVNENMHGEALDARLDHFRANLADLNHVLGQNDAVLSNGRSVSASDVKLLNQVHDQLRERFGRHLSLLRNRVGRN
jgi:hypothetical protein